MLVGLEDLTGQPYLFGRSNLPLPLFWPYRRKRAFSCLVIEGLVVIQMSCIPMLDGQSVRVGNGGKPPTNMRGPYENGSLGLKKGFSILRFAFSPKDVNGKMR